MDFLGTSLGFGDPNVEVEHQGWCSRMAQALCGMIAGLVLVIAMCVMLVWNEGRAVKTAKALKQGRDNVVEATCGVDPALDQKLVHLSCPLGNLQSLVDPSLGVNVTAVALKRTVEMYQWKESSSSRKTSSGTTVTTYSYALTWSETPISSAGFHNPTTGCAGSQCTNPAASAWPLQSNTWRSTPVLVGNHTLPADLVDKIGIGATVPPPTPAPSCSQPPSQPPASVTLANTAIQGSALVTTCAGQLSVGVVRVSWTYSSATSASVIARQVGATFQPWTDGGSSSYSVYLLTEGTATADAMFTAAENANTALTWALRFVGWILIWLGLQLLTGPLAVMPEIIPCFGDFIGEVVGCILCCLNCVLATGMALFFIAVGWVAYRPVVGVPLLVAAFLGCCLFGFLHYRRKKAKDASRSVVDPNSPMDSPPQPYPAPYPQQGPYHHGGGGGFDNNGFTYPPPMAGGGNGYGNGYGYGGGYPPPPQYGVPVGYDQGAAGPYGAAARSAQYSYDKSEGTEQEDRTDRTDRTRHYNQTTLTPL